MKLIYITHEKWEEDYVRTRLPENDFKIVFYSEPVDMTKIEVDTEAAMLSVFVSTQVTAAFMDKFPGLKAIVTRSTGFDHIDLAEAKKRNIIVSSVPYYGENTVAEFSFALLLALSRKICDAERRVRETGSFSQDELRGFDLAGKTIGIVGGGHIGIHAIRMATGFAMNVLVFDIRHDDALAAELGFQYRTMEDLLAQSDIIMLHVPYNQHTHHLINTGNIGLIKKGAYLINTARGAVIETDALVQALQSGIVCGAGLDVLEEEGDVVHEEQLLANAHPREGEIRTLLENHYLIRHPRVIITAHIAFNTTEAVERILSTAIEDIKAIAAGAPQNVVQ
jgi:D-lactate dehydrogenase